MSRKRSRQRERRQRPEPRRHTDECPPRKTSGLLAVIGILCIAGFILFAIGPGYHPPPPPSIDLDQTETHAARTIERHLDAVRRNPESGTNWGWLGALLHVYRFPEQAGICLNAARQLDPRNPRWPYFESLRLTTMAPSRAIDHAREAVALCGNHPELPRLRLAKLLAEQGHWKEARAELEQLIAEKPDFTPALLLLAHEANNRGDINRAITLAKRVTQDRRTAKGAWSLLALLHQRKAEPRNATEAARRAATLPDDAPVADHFASELSRRRGDSRALANQAHDHLAKGDLASAKSLIDTLVQHHPEDRETWLLLGRHQILSRDFKGAESSLRQHLQRDPQSTQGCFQLGTALMGQQRFEEAAGQFETAARLKPDFGPAFHNLGFALANTGKLKEATQAFLKALKHNPEHLDTYLLLVDVHLKVRDTTSARHYLYQAEILAPSDPRINRLRRSIANRP